MRAIIIAAGKGSRLYPLTKNTPKSLLEIGNGLTLLESQLHSLRENNIKDVTIIVGYRAEQIEAKIKNYEEDFDISTVYNPFYEVSNNLISVWMARHFMKEDFITINGDDIFNATVIENLLNSDEYITMVINQKDVYDEDDMKVIHQNKQIRRVGKDIPLSDVNGESIGIIKFSGLGRKIYTDTLEEMVRIEENKHVFYLKAINQIISKGYNVHYATCKPTDWGELDFHPDLVFIREYVKNSNLVDDIFSKSKTTKK